MCQCVVVVCGCVSYYVTMHDVDTCHVLPYSPSLSLYPLSCMYVCLGVSMCIGVCVSHRRIPGLSRVVERVEGKCSVDVQSERRDDRDGPVVQHTTTAERERERD